MRTISRISAAFLPLDGRSKLPVADAAILVDGERLGGTRKGDGHYVFTNLPPREHVYEISAPGYRTVRRSLPAKPELLPEIVLMQYAADYPRLSGITHFRLCCTQQGKPLQDAAVRVELRTAPGSLRAVENAAKGERALTLGGGYLPGMLCQPYRVDGQKEDILFTGYDRAAQAYVLREALPAAIKKGALLHPVWELETDRSGTAILPFVGLFMQAEELEFMFQWSGKNVKLATAAPNPILTVKLDF